MVLPPFQHLTSQKFKGECTFNILNFEHTLYLKRDYAIKIFFILKWTLYLKIDYDLNDILYYEGA